MFKKKILSLLVVLTVAMTVVGCGIKVGEMELQSGQTVIHISKDDTIQYGVSETFDKDYYNKKDLKNQVKQEVDAYNSLGIASTNGALSLKELKVQKDVATMVLEFTTSYDFGQYIETYNNPDEGTFYIGALEENKDCKISGKFYSPKEKEKLVSEDKIEKMDANILIVNEAMRIQIDGTVQYVSENCVVNDGIVETADTDDGMSYIVYTLK